MTSNTNTSNTNTNTHTHGGTMTSNTSTSNTTGTAVPVPAGTPKLPWSVKGRGKSATYCAALPAGKGKPGQRVALVAQSGAVTFAVLTEVRETVDNVTRWDFNRDTERMTPEVKRANRAAKSAATAAYWSSDAGLETARRIDQRAAVKGKGTTDTTTEPTPAPTTEPTSTPADDVATTVAMLIAGGMTPADAAAVGVAMRAATPAPTTEPTAAPAGKGKGKGTPAPAPTAADVAERCHACNRDRKGITEHHGAPELLVCPRCSSLDADTARTRAARHTGK